jgi:hypothetical protein
MYHSINKRLWQARHNVLTCPPSTNVGYAGDGKYLPTQSHIEEDRS